MNMLGKIFVFLNLCLAVAFMALATMVYATHKNWRSEITGTGGPKGKGWQSAYNELYREKDRLTRELNELKAQRDAEVVALERAKAISVAYAADLVKALKERQTSLSEKEAALANATTTINRLQENLKTAQESEKNQIAANSQILKDNDDRFKKVVKLNDELNMLASQLPAYQEREKQLVADVARARVLLEKLGATLADTPDFVPPPIEGRVLTIGKLRDPNLIELSLGKDDGLRVNHVVDLYRGPNYLGRATVVEIQGHRSVAKIIKDDLRAPVREDDMFTTKLQYLTSQIRN